jgi:hypothetical protein
VQSIWLKHDHERLESPLQLHLDPAGCLRTHNNGRRGFPLHQLLIVEDMDWIAEIKLNQRGDASRYGMHHRGTANLDLTLDVEANELCEAPSGPEETAAVHGAALAYHPVFRAHINFPMSPIIVLVAS